MKEKRVYLYEIDVNEPLQKAAAYGSCDASCLLDEKFNKQEAISSYLIRGVFVLFQSKKAIKYFSLNQ